MNKTVTINLSGIVFHIDENAYDLLKQYLDRLKSHFSGTQGKDEIISDIESRLAEMFNEKVGDSKNVIMMDDVRQVIEAMGKPEDIVSSDDEKKESSRPEGPPYYENVQKRFFRNTDDKVFGGVSSGIAAYFDLDPVWIRLAFVFFAIVAFGTGLLVYIILWSILPKAKTASEKLQMRGERVNVHNIEKNVREELEELKKRGTQFISSDQLKSSTRTAGQKVENVAGEVLRLIGKFIVAVFGIIVTIISISVLIGLTVAIFTGIGAFQFAVPHVITNMVLSSGQIAWLTIGALLSIGIPFTLLLLNGLKILFKLNLNLKMIGAVMAGLWLIGIGICAYNGIRIASEFSDSASVKNKQMITGLNTDTVYLRAIKSFEGNNDEWDDHHHNIHFGTGDLFLLSENSDSVLSHLVKIDVVQSDDDSIYLLERINSCGKTYEEAKQLANNVNYRYTIKDSIIDLNDYFSLNTNSKYRGQAVKLILMLPAGKSVFLDKSLGNMLDDIHNVNDTWDWNMLGHSWTMTKDGLECNVCPANGDKEYDHYNHRNETHIKIDSNGVDIKTM